MKSVYRDIVAEKIHIYPLGCLHFGSIFCDEKKAKGYIDVIAGDPTHKYAILMGDTMDTATKDSKTSIFTVKCGTDGQLDMAEDILRPIRANIIGAIGGNHEKRMEDDADFTPVRELCRRLDINYLGYCSDIHLRVGTEKVRTDKKDVPYYVLFAHHTTGGGGKTLGNKLNQVDNLRNLVHGADVYLGAHNHFEVVGKRYVHCPDRRTHTVKWKKQYLISVGGFMMWDGSYAEQGAMAPSGTGCPRILLDGTRHDVHCTI